MNIYENRSTISDDVRKWSNEYDAAIRLWNRQAVDVKNVCIWCRYHQMHWRLNVMSELLHSIVKQSNARWRLSWCQNCCCIRFYRDQINDDWCSNWLHSIAMKLNARWRLFEKIVRAASDVDVIRCTDGCFNIRTVASNRETIKCTLTIVLISELLLHLTPPRSDEWRLMFKLTAFDCDEVRCTLTIVWKNCQNCIWCRYHQMHWRLFQCQKDCIWFRTIKCIDKIVCDVKWLHSMLMHQMHWRNSLIVRLLHSIVKRSDARWRLSVAKIRWLDVFRDETSKIAFDTEIVECTDDFVCFFACYRIVERANCWFNVKKTAFDFEWSDVLTKLSVDVRWLHLISNDQMHWQSCLMSEKLHSTSNDQMHWRFVCFVVCYRTIKQTSCWFNRNVDSLHLIDLFRWLDYRKLDKTKWIWFVENVLMKSLNVFFIWKNKSSRNFAFKKSYNSSWIAELSSSSSFCRNQMKSIIRKTNSIQ